MTTTPWGRDKSVTSEKSTGASAVETDDVSRLREDIEQTRRELGDTVDALVAKTDVKARAQEKARHAKATAQERLQNVRGRASEFGTQARQTVTAPENAPKVKGGAAVVVGSAAAVAGIWAWQRRRRRPRTPWEKTLSAVQQAAASARGPLGRAGTAILTSDLTVRTVERAKEAAAAPEARPRAQGAAAAFGAMLVLVILRRAARRMPEGG